MYGNIVLMQPCEGLYTQLSVGSLNEGMYIVQVGKEIGKFFKQ